MRHLRRLGRIFDALRPGEGARPGRKAGCRCGPRRGRRRGEILQRRRRMVERQTRRSAVAFSQWCGLQGQTVGEAAERLGMSGSTLGAWVRGWGRNRLERKPRGRAVARVERSVRVMILALFAVIGPGLPISILQEWFPQVPRAELIVFQRRYRNAFRARHRMFLHALRWTRTGGIWAMDFSQPEVLIDGIYDRLLLVRDLASREQLASMPCEGEKAEIALELMILLFRVCGVPLVIKVDNGSAFISEAFKALCERLGVLLLYSPPRTPSYNGAVEAGNGWIKTRAFHEAARQDRPDRWTSDDIEAARVAGNALGWASGPGGQSPEEIWKAREPITIEERARLKTVYVRYEQEERARRNWSPGTLLWHREQSAIDRLALMRALVECGYLVIRRRRITPPITRPKALGIT